MRATKSSSSPPDSLSGMIQTPTRGECGGASMIVPSRSRSSGASMFACSEPVSDRGPAVACVAVRVKHDSDDRSARDPDLNTERGKQLVYTVLGLELPCRVGRMHAHPKVVDDMLIILAFDNQDTIGGRRRVWIHQLAISLRCPGRPLQPGPLRSTRQRMSRFHHVRGGRVRHRFRRVPTAAWANPTTASHPCVVASTCTLFARADRRIIRQKSRCTVW